MSKTKTSRHIRKRRLDIDLQELDGILDAAVEKPIAESDADKVKTALHILVDRLTPQPRTAEKTSQVIDSIMSVHQEESRPTAPGHGRNGAVAFTNAQKVEVAYTEFSAGCTCPKCQMGKVYSQKEKKTLLRFKSQPPVQARVYEMERMRCNLCGEIFTAPEPHGVGPEKYDESVPAMVAQLKYGSGMPFNRIEELQKNLGVPLPASTQWELVRDAAELMKPVHSALIEQAAQAQVIHNDDTGYYSRALIIDVLKIADSPAKLYSCEKFFKILTNLGPAAAYIFVTSPEITSPFPYFVKHSFMKLTYEGNANYVYIFLFSDPLFCLVNIILFPSVQLGSR